MQTSRGKWLKRNFTVRYKPQLHSFQATVRDLTRTFGETILCNNTVLLSQPISEASIADRFAEHFGHLHPAIYAYLQNFSHQNGYFYLGRSSLAMQLGQRQLSFKNSDNSYHFIICDNGDVLFLERYYLSDVIDLESGESFSPHTPMAICETLSCITRDGNRAKHLFLRENVTILHQQALELFPADSNIVIEHHLNADVAGIELEHQKLMQFLARYGSLYAEAAKENLKYFGKVHHQKLTDIMLQTYDLYNTPLDDENYLNKLNHYQQQAQQLQRSGRMKIMASIMLGIAATLLLAVSIAAAVFTFGAIAIPLAMTTAITVMTIPSFFACASTFGVIGLFKNGLSECKLAKLENSTGLAISHDRQQPSRPGNRFS